MVRCACYTRAVTGRAARLPRLCPPRTHPTHSAPRPNLIDLVLTPSPLLAHSFQDENLSRLDEARAQFLEYSTYCTLVQPFVAELAFASDLHELELAFDLHELEEHVVQALESRIWLHGFLPHWFLFFAEAGTMFIVYPQNASIQRRRAF